MKNLSPGSPIPRLPREGRFLFFFVVLILLSNADILSSAPPQIKLVPLTASTNSVRLQLQGSANDFYELQASADLRAWTTLLKTNAPVDILDFQLAAAPTSRFRFYRALSYTPPVRLLALSANTVSPASTLTLTASGVDPSAKLKVQLFTGSEFVMEAPVLRASTNQLTISVPPFYNYESNRYTSTKANLRIVQETAGGPEESNFLHDLTILDLPPSTAPPGAVTRALMEGGARALLVTMNDMAFIDLASGQTADSAPVMNALSNLFQLFRGGIETIDAIQADPSRRIPLGMLGSEPLELDAQGLEVSDRLLLALLSAIRTTIASPAPGLQAQALGPCGTPPPPPLHQQNLTDMARRISSLRDYSQQWRDWGDSAGGFAESMKKNLEWVPSQVEKIPLVTKAKQLSQTAHIATLLGVTFGSLSLDVIASLIETGELQAEDWEKATEFIERNKLLETSFDTVMGEVSSALGEAFVPDREREALEWLGFSSPDLSYRTWIAQQQPNRFWAADTDLVRAAEPVPTVTVSGCVSNLVQDAWSRSSIDLVLPPGTPLLFGLLDSDNSYKIKIPASQIGQSIPSNTSLILVTDGASVREVPVNLGLGSQQLVFSAKPAQPKTCDQCLAEYNAATAACDLLPTLIEQLQCINAALAVWQDCNDGCTF